MSRVVELAFHNDVIIQCSPEGYDWGNALDIKGLEIVKEVTVPDDLGFDDELRVECGDHDHMVFGEALGIEEVIIEKPQRKKSRKVNKGGR